MLGRFKNILLLTICSLYLIHFFTQFSPIQFILSIITTIVFFLCILEARKMPRFFGLAMLVSGIVIFIAKGEGIITILTSMTANLPLLTLIILVPLISIPFKLGGFFETILFYLKRMASQPKKMFLSISSFLFFFGPILNLGSIRVANEMVKDLRLSPVLLAKAYLVGFSTVILWSPYFASVALVLFYLNLNVGQYIYLGISLAIIQLIIGNILYNIYYERIERPQRLNFKQVEVIEEKPITEKERKDHLKTIILLLSILLLLMLCLFTLEHVTKWPMMLLVSLIAIVFPTVYCTVMKKWGSGKEQFIDFFRNIGKSVNNEVVMFTSAGVFASSLRGTSFAQSINHFLTEISLTSFLIFCLTVVLIIVFLTFIGLHPIVVVTVLITQLDPAIIGTSPAVLALLFMISWSISAILSPVNPLNLLVSGAVGKPSVLVGLKWNGVYVLTLLIIGISFVYLIH